jgi:UDP-N-acetylglucosamine--N-acetylmuramyl-(pentapeptide) pyrophosphoryl-undecaprenol N-acetylglucosamine transferase
MTHNILLSTGGTGGHIFPAIALKKTLEEQGFNVKITADSKFAKYHSFDGKHIFIPSANFVNKSPFKLIESLFTLTKGFFKSLYYINKYKPEFVIGFGGYATYPTMLAAIILGKEIILHEANTVIGKVNKLLLRKAKYLTTGFKIIHGVPSKYKDKIIYTGNPIRKEIQPKKSKKSNKNLSILIIGGSQGAKVFSKMIPDMIVNLPQEIKDKLYICQQAREEDIETIKARYAKENIQCEILSFFNDMNERFAQADLLIARSGASTISEVIKVGMPTVFIPYPTAADDHQYYNAKEIVEAEAGWLVKESNDAHLQLLQIVKTIYKDPSILFSYSEKLKAMDQDASENITKLLSSQQS